MRGYQKKVIYVKNTGSRHFEEAYFVLRPDSEGASASPDSMILEANRIIEENRLGSKRRPQGYYAAKYALLFTIGFILGAAFIILALAIS